MKYPMLEKVLAGAFKELTLPEVEPSPVPQTSDGDNDSGGGVDISPGQLSDRFEPLDHIVRQVH